MTEGQAYGQIFVAARGVVTSTALRCPTSRSRCSGPWHKRWGAAIERTSAPSSRPHRRTLWRGFTRTTKMFDDSQKCLSLSILPEYKYCSRRQDYITLALLFRNARHKDHFALRPCSHIAAADRRSPQEREGTSRLPRRLFVTETEGGTTCSCQQRYVGVGSLFGALLERLAGGELWHCHHDRGRHSLSTNPRVALMRCLMTNESRKGSAHIKKRSGFFFDRKCGER